VFFDESKTVEGSKAEVKERYTKIWARTVKNDFLSQGMDAGAQQHMHDLWRV
jgi:hypothetical protein